MSSPKSINSPNDSATPMELLEFIIQQCPKIDGVFNNGGKSVTKDDKKEIRRGPR